MLLALANAQSGLAPLERGRHALAATTRWGANRGLSIAQYAEKIHGKENAAAEEQTVRRQIWAYEVYQESNHMVGLETRRAGRLPAPEHSGDSHGAPRWPRRNVSATARVGIHLLIGEIPLRAGLLQGMKYIAQWCSGELRPSSADETSGRLAERVVCCGGAASVVSIQKAASQPCMAR